MPDNINMGPCGGLCGCPPGDGGGGDPEPPCPECVTCGDCWALCLGVLLNISGFTNGTHVVGANTDTCFKSNFNDSFSITNLVSTVGSVKSFKIALGTFADYGDPGILVRRRNTTIGGALQFESYVYQIDATVFCADGEWLIGIGTETHLFDASHAFMFAGASEVFNFVVRKPWEELCHDGDLDFTEALGNDCPVETAAAVVTPVF